MAAEHWNNQDHRGEERWHESLHAKVMEWGASCAVFAKKHDEAGYKARFKHIVFGMPAPVTTIVTGAVAALWESPDARYFVVPAAAVAAIFSAVHVFLDMGARAQRHWDYAARYSEIAGCIELQLARDVDFRRPADEFMIEILTNIAHLGGSAPALPGVGCCGQLPPIADSIRMPSLEQIRFDRAEARRRHENFLSANVPTIEVEAQ
jgi:hypothetical protein